MQTEQNTVHNNSTTRLLLLVVVVEVTDIQTKSRECIFIRGI